MNLETNMDFRPAWTQYYESQEKMMYDLDHNPEFKGPGWYITKGYNEARSKHYADTLLISNSGNGYIVMCWNHHNIFDALNAAIAATIHVDQR